MFTYLDPSVRERLIDDGKLRRIDAAGNTTDPRAEPEPGAKAISILGPIPLPLNLGGRHFEGGLVRGGATHRAEQGPGPCRFAAPSKYAGEFRHPGIVDGRQ